MCKHISLKVWVSDLANADIDRPVSIAFVFTHSNDAFVYRLGH